MADAPSTRVWIGRLTFVLIAVVMVFVQLVPLGTAPAQVLAPPDLLLALTVAWAARRPEYVPVLLVAVVFLTSDLLFQRPPGLLTALVLMLNEALRRRAFALRNVPFALEWLTAGMGIVAVFMGYRLVLAITMTPQAPLALSMVHMAMTVLAYPLVAFASHLLFGVSRPARGEVDALGHRL